MDGKIGKIILDSREKFKSDIIDSVVQKYSKFDVVVDKLHAGDVKVINYATGRSSTAERKYFPDFYNSIKISLYELNEDGETQLSKLSECQQPLFVIISNPDNIALCLKHVNSPINVMAIVKGAKRSIMLRYSIPIIELKSIEEYIDLINDMFESTGAVTYTAKNTERNDAYNKVDALTSFCPYLGPKRAENVFLKYPKATLYKVFGQPEDKLVEIFGERAGRKLYLLLHT